MKIQCMVVFLFVGASFISSSGSPLGPFVLLVFSHDNDFVRAKIDQGTICSYLRNILGYRLMNNKRLSRVSQVAYCTTHDSVDKPEQSSQQFDVKILEYIVCPISKQPLRYEASTNELICDELNVAYPIQNGIPNLVPGDARMMSEDPPPSTDS